MQTALVFKNGCLYYLDQQQLPQKEIYRQCCNLSDASYAIKQLAVRGAPLLGVFSAYSVYIAIKNFSANSKKSFFNKLDKIINCLVNLRPTAVNLSWSLKRIKQVADNNRDEKIVMIKQLILKEAQKIHIEDIKLCANIGKQGLKLIHRGDRILTHCNTGFLATSGEGTALSVIYTAARHYGSMIVYVDETRPLLQGARLTAWELKKRKIDVRLICDDMAAYCMQKKMVDKILVGADRITCCGDVANKIGTYNLAVLAKYHKMPFYVAVPFNTFDLSIVNGEDIPIEERNPNELRKVLGKVWIVPKKVKVYNPAFDVTPHKLITAIITDRGIIYPPFKRNIKKIIYGN